MTDAEYTLIKTEALNDLYKVLEGVIYDNTADNFDYAKQQAIKIVIRNAKASTKPYIETVENLSTRTTYQVRLHRSHKMNSTNSMELIKTLRTEAKLGLAEAYKMIDKVSKEQDYVDIVSFDDFGQALDLYWKLYASGFNVNVYRNGYQLLYGALFTGNDQWVEMTDTERKIALVKRHYHDGSFKMSDDDNDDIDDEYDDINDDDDDDINDDDDDDPLMREY